MMLRKTKNFLIIILLHALISSCQTMSDVGKAMRNEKTQTTDEFLVQKKKPLTEPPNLNELPEPASQPKNENQNNENIENILKIPKEEVIEKSSNNSSTEESIIGKIKR